MITLPVLVDGGRMEHRSYSVDVIEGGGLGIQAVLAGHYNTVLVHDDLASAYVRFRDSDNEGLPFAYFRFRDVQFFVMESGYTTGYQRYLGLIELAAAVHRLRVSSNG